MIHLASLSPLNSAGSSLREPSLSLIKLLLFLNLVGFVFKTVHSEASWKFCIMFLNAFAKPVFRNLQLATVDDGK